MDLEIKGGVHDLHIFSHEFPSESQNLPGCLPGAIGWVAYKLFPVFRVTLQECFVQRFFGQFSVYFPDGFSVENLYIFLNKQFLMRLKAFKGLYKPPSDALWSLTRASDGLIRG